MGLHLGLVIRPSWVFLFLKKLLSPASQESLVKRRTLVCVMLMRDMEEGISFTCDEDSDGIVVSLVRR